MNNRDFNIDQNNRIIIFSHNRAALHQRICIPVSRHIVLMRTNVINLLHRVPEHDSLTFFAFHRTKCRPMHFEREHFSDVTLTLNPNPNRNPIQNHWFTFRSVYYEKSWCNPIQNALVYITKKVGTLFIDE